MPVSDELRTHRTKGVTGFAKTGYIGQVKFQKSPSHDSVVNYEARVRVSGVSTVVATQLLGRPIPDTNGDIRVMLKSLFDAQVPGDYTVSIATDTGAGMVDSAESNAFTLPLP